MDMAALRLLLKLHLVLTFVLLAGGRAAAEPPRAETVEGAALATVAVPDAAQLDAETRCLALAVYWEARAESRAGQLAIAHTVLNRVGHDEFPDTICGVVAQKTPNGKSCQFSWWCDGNHDAPEDQEQWDKSVEAARAARNRSASDPTKGALFFHSTTVNPKWDGKHQRIGRIGDHVFYR